MCCQLHIAALISEYLKLRGTLTWGADEFTEISKNIPKDETGLKIDEGKSISKPVDSKGCTLNERFG